MVVFAADTFTRPDSPDLGDAEIGGAWAYAIWGISGNRARKGAGGSTEAIVVANTLGEFFTHLDCDLSTYVSGSQLFGVQSNFLNTSNLILWERVLVPGVEDAVKLYVVVAGVFNQRGIWGGGPGETGLVPTDPLSLRVERRGLNLSCLVNGVERVAYTLTGVEDAALGTAAGMRNEGTLDVFFDNFLVESIDESDTSVARTVAIRMRQSIRYPYAGVGR